MTILDKMLENCEKAGYATTKNVQKIAMIKKLKIMIRLLMGSLLSSLRE